MNLRSRFASSFFTPLALCVFTAAAPAAQEPEPAARLFERGAYAEEHEGDLETAAAYYERALGRALEEGDAELGREVETALTRLRQRTGEVPAERQTDEIIGARIADVLERLSEGQYGFTEEFDSKVRGASRELSVFGAASVPALEAGLGARRFLFADRNMALDTSVAAYLLTRLEEPEAVAAVSRAVASPDPLVRLAVVRHADHSRHREALVAAVGDAVRDVRDQAVRELCESEDVSLAPVLASAIDDEQDRAVRWFVARARGRLIERATDPEATPWLIERAAHWLSRSKAEPDRETAMLFVDQALRGGDHLAYWGTLENLFEHSWKDAPADLKSEVEGEVLARFAVLPFDDVAPLLAEIGGLRSLEAVANGLLTRADREKDLPTTLQKMVERMPAERFAEVLAIYAGLPEAANPDDDYESHVWAFAKGIARNEWGAMRAEDLARTFDALTGIKRAAFSEVLELFVHRWANSGSDEPMSPVLANAMESLLRTEDDTSANRTGVRGLALIGRPEGLPSLLSYSRISRDSDSRVRAHNSASRICREHPESAAAIVERAILEEYRVEPGGSPVTPRMLSFLPHEAALASFERLRARKDLSVEQRSVLIESLVSSIQGPAATQRVLDLWPEIPEHHSTTRMNAIQRFGRELFEPAVPILGDALRDTNESVRKVARDAFAAFKAHREALEEYEAWMRATGAQRESIQQLVALLESGDREVLLGAVRALGAIRARTALPQLVRLLEREDEDLRAAVHDAIGRMGEE